MSKEIIEKRLNELQTDLDWLNYNLKNVYGITNILCSAEAVTRTNILGRRTYLNEYLNNPCGVKSSYQKSLSYNNDVEQMILTMRAGVQARLKNVGKLLK